MKKINNKGFTLMEVLAVVVIIAILAGLAVPNILRMIDTSKKEKFITDAKQVIAKAKYYYKNTEDTEITLNELGIDLGQSPLDSDSTYDKINSKVEVVNNSGTLTYSIYLTDGTYCTKMKDPSTNEEIFSIAESNLKNDVVQKCS